MRTLRLGVFGNMVGRRFVHRIALFLWFIVVIVIQEGASVIIENGGWPWTEAVTTEDKNLNGKLSVMVIWRTNSNYLCKPSEWQKLGEEWTQDNVSLALSCMRAQLWLQATAALIIREGSEGIFPAEIQKAVWDNANDFEKKFQSLWTLVNCTYDPIVNMATAFMLIIRNATVYVIHLIIALGLNLEKTVLYPSEHRTWARMENGKWQSVNLESCVTQQQQGFICESNTIEAQDVCFNTEQGICHFEIHPNTSQKTVLLYVGQGCVCLRTACDFVEVDKENITLHSKIHSNFCICNFVRIVRCDFLYLAPEVSHQLIKSNNTMYRKLLTTLTLVKQLLKKQDTSHNWWDTLFGWSPTATGILNTLSHPIIV